MLSEVISLTLFPAVMAFAASSDLLTMTIANRVSLILIGGFVVLALLSGMSGIEVLWHVGASATVLLVAFICFARGWIGGGDAKLAAATALWFGFGHLMDYLVYASILGGALTLLIVQFRHMPLPRMLTGQVWAERLHRNGGGVPYGIALAIAALLVYPQTQWMTALGL
ncbi:MAG TPA: prepilin peptidase [Xanthobacteraceae bacterium]|jgi:prepilin peptidase CpaA|nr:prepilin peptidase [Xanthobacteraceae bacterium]